MQVLPTPKYNKEHKQHRIFAQPGEKGIRASKCKSAILPSCWWVRYQAEDKKYYYLNKSSVVNYLNKLSSDLGLGRADVTRGSLLYNLNEITKLRHLASSANQGDAEAQFKLANLLMGRFKTEKALHYFNKASDQNHLEAHLVLGSMYERGNQVQQDMNLVIKYYKKASDLGHLESHMKLGWIYWQGIGVPKDPKAAIEYFKKAAEKNDPKAQCKLGQIYEKGLGGIPKDEEKAIEYYKQAASQNNRDGIWGLQRISERQKYGASIANDPVPQDSKNMHIAINSDSAIGQLMGMFVLLPLLPIFAIAAALTGKNNITIGPSLKSKI